MKPLFAKKILVSALALMVFSCVFFSLTSAVQASSWIDPNSECTKTGDCNPCDLVAVTLRYANGIFIGAGAIAMFMFAFGGIVMLISYGNENRITWGKNVIIATVIGIFVTFAAWVLVNVFIGAFFGMPSSGEAVKIFGSQSWNVCPTSEQLQTKSASPTGIPSGIWGSIKNTLSRMWGGN